MMGIVTEKWALCSVCKHTKLTTTDNMTDNRIVQHWTDEGTTCEGSNRRPFIPVAGKVF